MHNYYTENYDLICYSSMLIYTNQSPRTEINNATAYKARAKKNKLVQKPPLFLAIVT